VVRRGQERTVAGFEPATHGATPTPDPARPWPESQREGVVRCRAPVPLRRAPPSAATARGAALCAVVDSPAALHPRYPTRSQRDHRPARCRRARRGVPRYGHPPLPRRRSQGAAQHLSTNPTPTCSTRASSSGRNAAILWSRRPAQSRRRGRLSRREERTPRPRRVVIGASRPGGARAAALTIVPPPGLR
jgi:hypothetical protein